VHFIRDNDIAPDQTYPLADLSGDDALRLLDAYRLAIAEASLSAVPTHQRQKFLARFAYQLVRPVAELPVWPVPLAIGLDVAVFAVLTQLLPFPGPPLSFHRFAGLAALHGLAQGLAVAWALYPKSISTFARPGPTSLPWRSYLAFGLGSYLCGVGISALAYGPDASIGRLLFILGRSVLFPSVTVSLSFLIDRRLQGEALGRGLWSLREGVVAALCVCACELLLRAFAAVASAPAPPPLIMGALSLQAFVLGALLPGTAFNFLVRGRIRDPGRDAGDHAPLMHELTT
jgi:hypothetical protein